MNRRVGRFVWIAIDLLLLCFSVALLSYWMFSHARLRGIWTLSGPNAELLSSVVSSVMWLSAVFVAMVVLCAWVLLFLRKVRLLNLLRFRREAKPFRFFFLLPTLLDAALWLEHALSLVVLIMVFVASVVLPLRRRHSFPVLMTKRVELLLLAIAMVSYAVFASVYSIQNHYSLRTMAFDLAIFENTIWNTVHGSWFFSSLEGKSHLGVHFSPALALVAPFYSLWPKTETLLIFQSCMLAASAIALYAVVDEITHGKRYVAFVIAISYLLHPAIAGANFNDFHELCMAPLAVLLTFWVFLRGRRAVAWCCFLLMLLVKEDTGVVFAGLCLFAAFAYKRADAWIGAVLGVLSFFVITKMVVPLFGGQSSHYAFYYQDLVPTDKSIIWIVPSLVLDPARLFRVVLIPEKIAYAALLLAPMALLPIFSGVGWCVFAYGLFTSFLASQTAMFHIGFQYALQSVPYLYVAAGFYLTRVNANLGRLLVAISLTTILTFYHVGMFVYGGNFHGGWHHVDFHMDQDERERYQQVQYFFEYIPKWASITASESLAPHFAARREIYTLRYAEHSPLSDYYLVRTGDQELLQTLEVFRRGDLRRVAWNPLGVLWKLER